MSHRARRIVRGPCFTIVDAPVWTGGKLVERFVQFSLERYCFHLDMPAQTLSRLEAAQIRSHTGRFFYLSERPYFRLHEEDVEGDDPFRAVYFYGEERVAARDMAFIFASVWRVPLESAFCITAAAFSGRFQWENAELLPSVL